MGREPGQGRGLPAGGKTRPVSPLQWEAKGGGGKAYGVARNPSGVRDNGGGHKAYGVGENPREDLHGVGGGVKLPQGINTPGVEELPRGDKTPKGATKGKGVTGEDRQEWGQKPYHHPSKRGKWIWRRQKRHGARAEDGSGAAPAKGHSGRRQQRGAPATEIQGHQRRQAHKRHALAPQVWITGARGAGGESSQHGAPGKGIRPRGHKGDGGREADGDRDGRRDRAARDPSARHAGGRRRGENPPDQSRALNTCDHPRGEGGRGPLTRQRVPTAHSQGAEGDTPTRQCAPLSRGHGREEEGRPPTQQRA